MQLSLRQRRAVRRGVVIASTGALVAGVLAVTSVGSLAAPTLGPYTIDGVVPGSDGGTAITDPSGSTKELGPINSNSTKIGVIHTAPLPMLGLTNPNGQVDLNTAWLDLQRVGTHDYLYFAWQRDANSGSGFIAYEFMHAAAPTACAYDGLPANQADIIAGCNPWANRAAGDFMILWDQQGGSRDLYKRVWSGSGSNLTLGSAVALGSNAQAQYSSDGFRGEAAVDLTGAGLTTGTDCTTLANTVPSTVTGNSDTADYKDTVLTTKTLSTCKSINIVKTDDAGAALGGAVFTLYHNVAPLAAPRTAADLVTDPALTCTTDATTGLCSISSVPFGDYWVVETSTPANHDTAADQAVTVSSTSTTASLTLTFVDPRQRGSILIRKTDGTNDLAGAAFSATLTGGSAVNIPLVSGSTSLFCLGNLLLGGTYAIAETTVPAGYTGATNIPSVTVSTASTCADRVAATTIVPDRTVTNNPAPGTINIAKTDDAGLALNGAVFTLYKDTNGDGAHQNTETTTEGSPQTTSGTGTLAGTAQFANVPLGKYCVVETTTPTGYSTADPQCVTVGLGSTAGTGQTINLTFVDPRTHRVIVIVCHEGSNTLDSSQVTLDGVTKASLAAAPTGLTEATLCGLGGATFGGKSHGTYTPSVVIPSHP